MNRSVTSEDCLAELFAQHAQWLARNGGSRADLRGANLSGLRLSTKNFRDADCRGADFRDADCRGVDFREADCRDADFRGANLRGADCQDANFRRAYFRNADCRGADFRGTDFSDAHCQDANFPDAEFRGARFSRADLREANLGSLRVIQLGPLGSRRDYLVIVRYPDGVIEAQAGCFRGDLEALEARVAITHADNVLFRREYTAAIAYARTVFQVGSPT